MPGEGRERRWEAAKSAFLALLVLTSLLLSFGLWWGAVGPLRGEELWREEAPSPPVLPDWSRIVAPNRLFLHAGEAHLLFYPGSEGFREVWEAACVRAGLLEDLGPAARAPLREAELRGLEGALVLEARFPTPLPGALVARAYRLRADPGDGVEGVVVLPDRWPYVAVRRGGQLYPLEGADGKDTGLLARAAERLAAPEAVAGGGAVPLLVPTLPEGMTAAGGLWVPRVATVPRLAAGFVPPPEYGRTLVDLFFADPTVVRRIEERDGAIIFTDGRSGLRVYPSGALEYNTPRPDPARGSIAPEAAVSVALSFLATHGGIPAETVLWGCWPVREGGGQAWAVGMALDAGGLLALAPGGAASLAVGDQGLYGYRAAAWLPWRAGGGSVRVIPAQEALARLAREQKGRARVEDMYLAYAGDPVAGAELSPAWLVRTEAGLWAVDAVSGRVVSLAGRW